MSGNVASTIVAKIITLLKNIDGMAAYQTDVGERVYRYFIEPQTQSADDFPYICFGPINYAEEYASANYQIKQIDATATLALFNAYSGDSPDEAIMNLYGDVKIALEADPTLGGYALINTVSGLSVAQVIGDKSGFVSGYMTLNYTFRHTPGDPSVAR